MMKKYRIDREAGPSAVDYERELNPEQHSAVMHGEGPALVLAGAGTGKTRVVTYRVARLVESGVRPANILLLTFTNKAAREMMRRAGRLMGKEMTGLFGGTFHHAAHLILRRHHRLAGYARGFSILDREDCRELFDACIAEACRKKNSLPKGAVFAELYSLSRNTASTMGEAVLTRFPQFAHLIEEIETIAGIYEKKKALLNLADFDDLLLKWKLLFEENAGVREYYGEKFSYILVDEYQDTNRLQAEIVDLTAGPGRNLMVVGDDAQSIYSFRGADFENILRFPEKYPDSAVFKLTTNYRSTPEILYLANSIISLNRRQFRKDLRPVAESGGQPAVIALGDMLKEARFVASSIEGLYSGGKRLDRIAVLYRSHYQSMQIQMELQRRGIPFEVRSGLKFFEQAHIKDVLAYMRIVVNPLDEISWKRVLKLVPGIGRATTEKLWVHLQASGSPLDFVSDASRLVPKKSREGFEPLPVLLRTLGEGEYRSSPSAAVELVLRHGYEDHLHNSYPNAEIRIEDILQMARFASSYGSLEAFISEMTLQGVTDADGEDPGTGEGRVVLSTVHQAKGLEWDVVFIAGMNDGRFPSSKSLRNNDEEEERRLFYVGATRAREALCLCYPASAGDWSQDGHLMPSRFLRELPRDCFDAILVEEEENDYNMG